VNNPHIAENPPTPPTVQQSPRDLQLYVFAGQPAGDYRVLRRATVVEADWRVEFTIIGESHTVAVLCAGRPMLSEMLACMAVPRDRSLHLHHFADLQSHTYAAPALPYRVEVAFGDAVPDSAHTPQLQFAFPEIWGRIPITQIGWRIVDEGVSWWTLHTYPDAEGVCVVTSRSDFAFHPVAIQESRGR
jgi:hypothetical protein